MMSNKDQHMTVGDLREAVEPVLRVLSQLGGHFTFADQQGEQFVIARKTDFDAMRGNKVAGEKQLPIESARPNTEATDEAFGAINEEIALYRSKQEEQDEDHFEDDSHAAMLIEEMEADYRAPMPPPVRLRFEAIRGDLPPDLQE